MRVYNTRAMLEVGLRDYVALTVGDSITVEYGKQQYEVEVLETQPRDAVCIIDADIELDFATPKDALPKETPRDPVKDFEVVDETVEPDVDAKGQSKTVVFSGAGQRIDGLPAEPYVAPESGQAEDSDDEMPWKKKIPGGVKWTSAPYGYTKGQDAYNGKPDVVIAASSSNPPSKMTHLASGSMSLPSGDFVAASEESREAQHQAAAKRMEQNAGEIEANRRRLEQEAKEKAQQEARKQAEQEELERKAQQKKKAALAKSAPAQQKMQLAGKAAHANGNGSGSSKSSLFCGCLRSKAGPPSSSRI